MRKGLFPSAIALLLMVAAIPAWAEPQYCSADLIDRAGQIQQQVRVDCDSAFAGRCVQEISENGKWNWFVVNDRICDALVRLPFHSARN